MHSKNFFSLFSQKELGLLAFFLLLNSLLLTVHLSLQKQIATQHAATTSLLPGQQIWSNGVSSFLFGTNDTIRWSQMNAGNTPSIPQALNTAHFQLLRTWFFANQNGSDISNRMQVVQQSGMIPLCVLPDWQNASYNQSVVTTLGNKCNIYEFGNEPDSNMSGYIQAWNTQIPQLRKINPNAKFIGPVAANHNNVQVFLNGVKASGVLPDAISFHRYSCSGGTAVQCLSIAASDFTNVITLVKGWVSNALGSNVPVGITEWNYDARNPPASYGSDPTFMDQFTKSVINQMIQTHLDFANQFDLANGAGMGGLDMFDVLHGNGAPKQQFTTMKNLISQYSTGSAPSISPSGGTTLSLTLCPHGIANCGDNANPQSVGNFHPLTTTRPVTVSVSDSNNTVTTGQGSVIFDAPSGTFKGAVSLGNIPSGQYLIRVTMPQYLTRRIGPSVTQITTGQANTTPEAFLIAGDINGDNKLDILDYNILVSCFGSKATTPSCNNQSQQADINDDGKVDGIDYNLFLRELSVQQGDGGPTGTPTPPLSPNPS